MDERTIQSLQTQVQLKALLNAPLPGGRGFQKQRQKDIKHLCLKLAELL